MALQINESITSREGTVLPSFYVRLEPLLGASGVCVEVEYSHYTSKAAFQLGATPIVKNEKRTIPYDRTTDGSDLAQFAHDALKAYLTTSQGVDVNDEPLDPQYAVENVTIQDL